MDDPRIDLSQMIERLHRRYLDVVRIELDRMGCRDLTPVQAVLLANVGEDEVELVRLVAGEAFFAVRGKRGGKPRRLNHGVEHLVDGHEIIDDEGRRKHLEGIPMRKVGEREWIASGRVEAEQLQAATGFAMPTGDYETLAGFVLYQLGHIPAKGESFHWGPWRVTVKEVQQHRVVRVEMERTPDAADEKPETRKHLP